MVIVIAACHKCTNALIARACVRACECVRASGGKRRCTTVFPTQSLKKLKLVMEKVIVWFGPPAYRVSAGSVQRENTE